MRRDGRMVLLLHAGAGAGAPPPALLLTWPVEEPSKFQMRSSETSVGTRSSVIVLLRRSWPEPPIQTYSAWMRVPCGRLMYLASTPVLSCGMCSAMVAAGSG